MLNIFKLNEKNLGIAGSVLLLEIVGCVVLGVLLIQLQLPEAYALIVAWAVNLTVAWYLAKAARTLNKNVLVYGLLSALGPPVAIANFVSLYHHDLIGQIDPPKGPQNEA